MTPAPQARIGRLVATLLITVSALSALLVWEIEHVGSLSLAVLVAAAAISAAALVTRRAGREIAAVSAHYEALLSGADQSSRRLAEAMRMKDEFLATVSHELRTPLNSVLGWARLLASGRLDPELTAKAITAIERAGWAQSRLIDDLLDMSRIVSGKLQITTRPVALDAVVESAVRALQSAAQAKRISLITRLGVVPALEADADRLHQVVWNLVSNAIKFTPAGGRVVVSLSVRAGSVVIAVTDTGIGFPPAAAAYLFERFRQGDSSSTREHGGVGLGLGIVRHLVELHGGTVSATSDGPNRGALFEVKLPLRPVTLPVVDAPPADDMPTLAGVSVLVVDDNPSDLELVRVSLERCGAHVDTAATAREARERHTIEPPDVLVSDLRLPDADGWQLIREIREIDAQAGRSTPAAAVSALARSEDRRRTLDAGFRMHVSKPVDPVELAAAVEQLARESRG